MELFFIQSQNNYYKDLNDRLVLARQEIAVARINAAVVLAKMIFKDFLNPEVEVLAKNFNEISKDYFNYKRKQYEKRLN